MATAPRAFDPARHRSALVALLDAFQELEEWTPRAIDALLRRHPKDGSGFYSRSDLIAGFRAFGAESRLALDEAVFLRRLRRKPVRTRSGVTPVTVLTKPFPCPGRCIFCPNDPTMPKSYIASEPGCQRAEAHRFDPYEQTFERLRAFHANGHPVEKAEILVLGGTWSHYPAGYQRWFVKRCFDALNDWGVIERAVPRTEARSGFEDLRIGTEGAYNDVVRARIREQPEAEESASLEALREAQRRNESASVRCVGLVLETRPDAIDAEELLRLRQLGATKIQLGVQSLDDEILRRNRRGHDAACSRRAATLLRRAGFKVQLHWMPNLLGATPASDRQELRQLFRDPALRPDELKIYPCSLIDGTELVAHHAAGRWRPYGDEELTGLLTDALSVVPEYCRLSRVIRDIPSQEILVGNRRTNYREVAERSLAASGRRCLDIRSREIGGAAVAGDLSLRRTEYASAAGTEVFLQAVDGADRIVGFARLSLPGESAPLEELGNAALLREVHVYGPALAPGQRAEEHAQHGGLGRRLVAAAAARAHRAGHEGMAVISAVGTRPYYRRLGFRDGALYQHLDLTGGARVRRR